MLRSIDLPTVIVNNIYSKLVAQCREKAQVDIDSLDCVQFAKDFPRVPVICLYSRRDEFVECSDSMEIYNALATHFKYFLDCNAKHNESRKDDKIARVFNLLSELRKKKEKHRQRVKTQLSVSKRMRSNTFLNISHAPGRLDKKSVSSRKLSLGRVLSKNGGFRDKGSKKRILNKKTSKKRVNLQPANRTQMGSPIEDSVLKDLQKVSVNLSRGSDPGKA